jgi:transposase
MVVAVGLIAAIGPIDPFDGPERLVAYLGLNPSMHQSGECRPRLLDTVGSPSKVEPMRAPCWSKPVRGPGPLRAFFERVRRRRGNHIAAVAVARKLAVIIWHLLSRGEDYAWVRPAPHAKKLRDLELRSGLPSRRGQRGTAYAYNLAAARRDERRRIEAAELAYRRLTEGWSRRRPKRRAAAIETTTSAS